MERSHQAEALVEAPLAALARHRTGQAHGVAQLLPAPLRLTPSFPFAGRSQELTMLRTLLPQADGEGRHVALLGGEPGSGKSRLVREFAHEAAAEGVLVLYGACDAVVRTPYQPFVEALDQLVRQADQATLRADLGLVGGELTRLLPELPQRAGDLPARRELYLGVAGFWHSDHPCDARCAAMVPADGHGSSVRPASHR